MTGFFLQFLQPMDDYKLYFIMIKYDRKYDASLSINFLLNGINDANKASKNIKFIY